MRQIAIGDIHGCARTLKKLLEEKVRISVRDHLYFLGDYINKGPDSKGVIDQIFSLRRRGYNISCLRGNHEQYLLEAMHFSWEEVAFKSRGGDATLFSFGKQSVLDIPSNYVDFIHALPYYFELEHHFLIHAGLNFDLEDPFKDDYAMLNIKKMEVDPAKIGGKILLHGHVPKPLDAIKQELHEGKQKHYSLDAGCVYNHQPGMSHLVAYDMTNNLIYEQRNLDGFSF